LPPLRIPRRGEPTTFDPLVELARDLKQTRRVDLVTAGADERLCDRIALELRVAADRLWRYVALRSLTPRRLPKPQMKRNQQRAMTAQPVEPCLPARMA